MKQRHFEPSPEGFFIIIIIKLVVVSDTSLIIWFHLVLSCVEWINSHRLSLHHCTNCDVVNLSVG